MTDQKTDPATPATAPGGTVTTEEIAYRPCTRCEGSGEIDPTGIVDENDLEAVLKELADSAGDTGRYGLYSDQRGMRIRMASRIVWLANRVIWLENCENLKAEDDTRDAAMRESAGTPA